jgi:MFS family permease
MQNPVADYNEKINANYRWNFFWMALDNMMFFFIFMGLSPYTILPYYVEKFTDSKILIGLIPTLYLVGTTLPQLVMAKFLQTRKKRKKYLVAIAATQRMGILGVFLLSLLQPRMNISATLTLVIFFLMHTLQHVASGFYVPAWIDFLGKCIPRRRGFLFGISNFLGGLMGLALGWLLSYLLERYPFQQAMPVIFGIALAASLISLVSIISWREVVPPDELIPREAEKANSLSGVFKDRNFVQYLIWRGMMVTLEIATPFYALSALEILRVSAAQLGVFTTILAFSQATMNPLWGWLGDKKGFLRIVQISALAGSMGAFLAVLVPTLPSYYAVFFLVGMMLSGLSISSINIIFEFSPEQLVPLYTAVSQIALTPLSSVVPLLGGVVAEQLGYATNYWLAGVLGLASLVGISAAVKNPKNQPRGQLKAA